VGAERSLDRVSTLEAADVCDSAGVDAPAVALLPSAGSVEAVSAPSAFGGVYLADSEAKRCEFILIL